MRRAKPISFRVLPHAAARSHRNHLQAPAAAEQGRARRQHGAHHLDLALDRRPAVVNIQRRARDGHTVVAFDPHLVRQVGAGISGVADIDDGAREQFPQQFGVAHARRHAARGREEGTAFGRVAFHDQQAEGGH
jgi:hypothetical protein